MTKILIVLFGFIAFIAIITALWSVLHNWFKEVFSKVPGWIIAGIAIFILYKFIMYDIGKNPSFYAPFGIGQDSVSVKDLQRIPDKWRGIGDSVLKIGL